MMTDPNVALGLFVWLVLVLYDLLIRDDNRRLRREAEAGALRRAGERMRAAVGPAAGMAGALPYGADVREAARRYEQEVLDAIQEDIATREDRASREASIHQAIGIDTSAYDDAVAELSEAFERINATTRAEPVDTGELRQAVDPTRHLVPPQGSDVMPCCGRTPFQVSAYDEITLYEEMVTCSTTRRRDRSDEDDETFEAEVLDRFDDPVFRIAPDHDVTRTCWQPDDGAPQHTFHLDGSEIDTRFALCDCETMISRWDGIPGEPIDHYAEVEEFHGCFICRPDDPEASDETCVVCWRRGHGGRVHGPEAARADDGDAHVRLDGLAVGYDPDATAPAWTSTDDPPATPEWQAWWAAVTYARWREALDRDDDRRRAAMLHVAERYTVPCSAVPCRLCRWLRCRHVGREPVGCETCFEETVAARRDLRTHSYRDSLATTGIPEGVDPVLLVDGPLAGWVVGVRETSWGWSSIVGEPFSNTDQVTYARFHESRSLARLDRDASYPRRLGGASGSGHHEPPTEQYGPGAEDLRSTSLPDGCVADVWRDDHEQYAPCGEEPASEDLPFCADHLARMRQ